MKLHYVSICNKFIPFEPTIIQLPTIIFNLWSRIHESLLFCVQQENFLWYTDTHLYVHTGWRVHVYNLMYGFLVPSIEYNNFFFIYPFFFLENSYDKNLFSKTNYYTWLQKITLCQIQPHYNLFTHTHTHIHTWRSIYPNLPRLPTPNTTPINLNPFTLHYI